MTLLDMIYTSLAVWALGAILFRSYPAGWLAQVVPIQRQLRGSRRDMAYWQLRNGCVWNAHYARNPNAAQRPPELTPEQRAAAERIAEERAWPLLALNMAQYFLSCAVCHHFWAALLILRGNLFMVLACLTVATGLHVLVFGAGQSTSGGSGGCGAGRTPAPPNARGG